MKEIVTTDGYKVLIDDEDYELVSKYKWGTFKGTRGHTRYAQSYYSEMGKQVLLHRYLMNAPKGIYVDHVNGNGLDCRRDNMRLCTNQQNSVNRKGRKLRGATYNKAIKAWQAKVMVNYKTKHLGFYDTAEEAAKVAQDYMKRLHGEFYATKE